MARLVTFYLRLKFKARYKKSAQVAIQYFMDKLIESEKPYNMPKLNFGCPIEKQNISGMDVYILNGKSATNKTILYIHGGGYVNQALYFHWRFIKKLIKRTNAKIIFPIYPLAPFHTYKEMYEKMLKLYDEYGKTSDELIFMGDSAGGGFILSFYEYLLIHNLRIPDKVISISPWLDLATDNPEIPAFEQNDPMLIQAITQVWAKLWAGDDIDDYLVSPINFEQLGRLENITLFTGTDEILYPDALKFFDKITDNRCCELIIGQNMNHVYPLYPIPEAKIALNRIVDKITERQ